MTKSCSKERARNRPDASKAEDGANELPAKRSKHRRTQRRFPIVRLAPTIMRCRMLLFEKNRHHALDRKDPPPRSFTKRRRRLREPRSCKHRQHKAALLVRDQHQTAQQAVSAAVTRFCVATNTRRPADDRYSRSAKSSTTLLVRSNTGSRASSKSAAVLVFRCPPNLRTASSPK